MDRGWFMFFVTLLNQAYWVAGATLGALQLWKKNMLLSLFLGTALYMLLVQTCFA